MRFGNQEAPILFGSAAKGSQALDVDTTALEPRDGVPVWKRALDITCIVLALPLIVPVMLLIFLTVKIVSPGPALFLSERVGFRGRRFICFKFRTMKVDADTGVHQRHLADLMRSDAPMVKMDTTGDARLIPFGSALRATGLDELPQLLNVLAGEMSIVGPRPCLPYEYDSYLPSQKRRFITLPGLTGLWQVSGKNKTTFSEMIALDVRYAETKSPWFDLKIMFKTFPALLSQVIESRFKKKAAPAPSHQRRVLDDSYVCDTSPDESPDRAATALQENSRRMEIATTAHAEN